uniref:Peptidase S1 domain-containing protein n=1 Tax=Anopheles maculatus TaxID=74869 RepID=A0A182SB39_9DIPT
FDRNGTSVCTQSTQKLRIQRVIIHPKFGTNSSADNIALIEFLNPADISQPNVNPICLPVTAELRANPKTNLNVAFISRVDQSYSNIPVRYLESVECMRQYADRDITLNLEHKRLCAEIANKQDEQNCNALIAGSPLQEMKLFGQQERYFLRGFELLGLACNLRAPPLYNNLEAYLDWILYNMRYNEPDAVETNGELPANGTLESRWLKLQQEPGREKLRLFNMSACGMTKTRTETTGQITIYPWSVTVFGVDGLNSDDIKVHGMGALISEWYILTSAHVVQQKASWRYLVMGLYNILLQSECRGDSCVPYQEGVIRHVIVHPSYEKDPRNHNIALIELQQPANLTNPHISPICMPFIKELQKSKPLDLVVTSEEEYDVRSKQLTGLAPTACQRQLAQEGFLTSARNVPWCAVDADNRGQSALLLNPGASLQALLQFDEQQRYFLRGVNLRNNLPNEFPYLPELFTNVDRFLDWIVDSMKFKEPEPMWPTATKSVSSRQVSVNPIRNTSKNRLLDFNNCGRMSTSNETVDSNIIPWMGYLSSDKTLLNATKDSRCAVTLISEWYAVGLAHCFSSNSTKYSILFGINSVQGLKECTECVYPTQTIPVERITIHPQYNNSTYNNDIALVK